MSLFRPSTSTVDAAELDRGGRQGNVFIFVLVFVFVLVYVFVFVCGTSGFPSSRTSLDAAVPVHELSGLKAKYSM